MLGSSYVRVGGNWEAQHNRLKTRLLSILNISVPILISARLRVGVETPLELYSWLFRMKVVFPELWPFLIHNRIWGLVVVWYVDCGGLLRWAGRSSFWVSRCPLLLAPLALALSHGCRLFDLSGPEYWPQAGQQPTRYRNKEEDTQAQDQTCYFQRTRTIFWHLGLLKHLFQILFTIYC